MKNQAQILQDKLDELMEFAKKLGIKISYNCIGGPQISLLDNSQEWFYIRYIDDEGKNRGPVEEFPVQQLQLYDYSVGARKNIPVRIHVTTEKYC